MSLFVTHLPFSKSLSFSHLTLHYIHHNNMNNVNYDAFTLSKQVLQCNEDQKQLDPFAVFY